MLNKQLSFVPVIKSLFRVIFCVPGTGEYYFAGYYVSSLNQNSVCFIQRVSCICYQNRAALSHRQSAFDATSCDSCVLRSALKDALPV
jgi:hypothetical protein